MNGKIFKQTMVFSFFAALICGGVGMGLLFYMAGWKWNLCVGMLMAALYFRIIGYFAMIGHMESASFGFVEGVLKPVQGVEIVGDPEDQGDIDADFEVPPEPKIPGQVMFSGGEVSARLTMAGVMLESMQAHAERTNDPNMVTACKKIYEAYNQAIYDTKALPNWERFKP